MSAPSQRDHDWMMVWAVEAWYHRGESWSVAAVRPDPVQTSTDRMREAGRLDHGAPPRVGATSRRPPDGRGYLLWLDGDEEDDS